MTLKFINVIRPLALVICLSATAQDKNETQKMFIPSESDVGRVFMANLFTTLTLSPPDQILIYPAVYKQKGKTVKINEICALIEGNSISEFLNLIEKPSRIESADESCPNIIFSWNMNNFDPTNTILPTLKGYIYIGPEDYVRLRLHTDNVLYPKIDFVYTNTGLKSWLQERSTQQEAASSLTPNPKQEK